MSAMTMFRNKLPVPSFCNDIYAVQSDYKYLIQYKFLWIACCIRTDANLDYLTKQENFLMTHQGKLSILISAKIDAYGQLTWILASSQFPAIVYWKDGLRLTHYLATLISHSSNLHHSYSAMDLPSISQQTIQMVQEDWISMSHGIIRLPKPIPHQKTLVCRITRLLTNIYS